DVGAGRIAKVRLDHQLAQMLDDLLVADGHEDLDATIEVPLHQVGAPEIDLLVPAVGEPEQPRMLEEPSDDRAHVDPLAHLRDARTKAADTTGNEIDEDARLRRAIE